MSKTHFLLLDEQILFREAFALRVFASDSLELVGETSSWDEVGQQLVSSVVQVLLASTTLADTNPFHKGRLFRERFPGVQVAFLDSYFVEDHLHQSLKSGALGYFTRCDHFDNMEAGLQKIAAGQQAFTPESSESIMRDRRIDEFSTHAPKSQLALLSARELEIMRHLAEGLSVRQIADKLCLARSTVDNHKSRLMRKLNVHKSVDLVRIAIREGLIST